MLGYDLFMNSTTVDAYISSASEDVQGKLRALRTAIIDAVPEANERLSYGMPYYHYKGRLAYFRLAKHHIGLYIPTPVVEQHQAELEGYDAAQATIRSLLNQELPLALIQKLVKARAKLIDEAVKGKGK